MTRLAQVNCSLNASDSKRNVFHKREKPASVQPRVWRVLYDLQSGHF